MSDVMKQAEMGGPSAGWTRRGALIITGEAALLLLAAACSDGPSSPQGAVAHTGSSSASPSPTTGGSNPNNAPTTPARPETGTNWDLTWQTVTNPSLLNEMRREGEVFPGDPTATDDPTSWQRVAVIGIPVREMDANDPGTPLNVAFWHGGNPQVEYATFDRTLPVIRAGGVDMYATRVSIGPDETLLCFVSGGISDTPLADGPDWAAESTKVATQTVNTNPAYFQVPLV